MENGSSEDGDEGPPGDRISNLIPLPPSPSSCYSPPMIIKSPLSLWDWDQIHGKTIHATVESGYGQVLLVFTDASFVEIGADGDCDEVSPTLQSSLSTQHYDLDDLVKAGVITPTQSAQAEEEQSLKRRERDLADLARLKAEYEK